MSTNDKRTVRRRRVLMRSVPLAVVFAIAFVAGAVVGSSSEKIDGAERFADAWERQDFKAMYAELDAGSKDEYSLDQFTNQYVDAQTVATATRVVTDKVEPVDAASGDAAAFEATVDTHAFGQVNGRIELPLNDEGQVAWQPNLVFPGLNEDETLDRRTKAPARAKILTSDGKVLAEGPAHAP